MKLIQIGIILFVLGLVFFGCQTSQMTVIDVVDIEIPENLPNLVQASLSYRSFFGSISSYFDLLLENVESLFSQNMVVRASELLNSALVFADNNLMGLERVEAYIQLANIYFESESLAQSVLLLNTALELIVDIPTSNAKNTVLQKMTEACIALGDNASEILQGILQQFYILPDVTLRSGILISTAIQYQNAGEVAHVLLQQSIPAIAAIEDPLDRSLRYSALALRLQVEESTTNPDRYFDRVFEFLETYSMANTSINDDRVTEILINLVHSGYIEETIPYLRFLNTSQAKLSLILEMAKVYLAEARSESFGLVLEEANAIIASEQDTESKIASQYMLSRFYFEIGQARIASEIAEEMQEALVQDLFENYDQEAASLAIHYSRIDNFEQALQFAITISDLSLQFQTIQSIIEALLESESQNGQVSENLLTEALSQVDSVQAIFPSAVLSYDLYARFALLYARLGELDSALNLLWQIPQADVKAFGLAEMYRYIELHSENANIINLYLSRISSGL